VNPKAQSCVPLPAGLDLERENDAAALAAFLADDASHSKTRGLSTSDALKRVCFVEDPGSRFAADEDQFDEDGEKDDEDEDDAVATTTTGRANNNNDPFYLRETSVDPNQVDVDDVPVVRLTAEDLGVGKKKKKKKDGAKKKKARKVHKSDVDTSELMPAGFKDTAQSSGSSFGKSLSGLAAIDITTPLRDDEVMPTIEHRITPSTTPAPAVVKNDAGLLVPEPAPAAAAKRKSSKKKKKKEEASSAPAAAPEEAPKKTKKKKAKEEPTAKTTDLLDLLDFGTTPAVDEKQPKKAASFNGFDLLGTTPTPPTPPLLTKKEEPDAAPPPVGGGKEDASDESKVPSSEELASLTFAPLATSRSLVFDFALRDAKLVVRCRNASSKDRYVSARVAVASTPVLKATATPVTIAAAVGPGAAAAASLDVEVGAFDGPALLRLKLSFAVEGLVPEPVELDADVTLPPGAFLAAEPTTPEAFASTLTSGTWHAATVKITAFGAGIDAVANYLNAAIVERGDGTASMLAQHSGGLVLAVLVKRIEQKTDNNKKRLKVDLKSNDPAFAAFVADNLADLSKKLRKHPSL